MMTCIIRAHTFRSVGSGGFRTFNTSGPPTRLHLSIFHSIISNHLVPERVLSFVRSLRLSTLLEKAGLIQRVCSKLYLVLPSISTAVDIMSLEPYYFRPLTPPESVSSMGHHYSGHSRNVSTSSYMTCNDSSPESLPNPTPTRAPVYRQHGPTLLPKIRTQDNNCLSVSAGQTHQHKRALSNVSNVSSYSTASRPVPTRSSTEPLECTTLMSPVSMTSYSRASSVAPVATTSSHKGHMRNFSSASVDETVLSRYGYPTYRQLPSYMAQTHQSSPSPSFAPAYLSYQNMQMMDAPAITIEQTYEIPFDNPECYSRPSSTSPPPQQMYPVATDSLLNYLTQPTQPVNLVRQLTLASGRGLASHFWWDVRNVRPWASFSLDTMSTIPDLLTLLNFQHDVTSFPLGPPTTQTITPNSEAELATLINKIYFPKVNTAASLSLGQNCPSFYLAPAPPANSTTMANSHPTFLANYPTDSTSRTLSGLPRGRVVGLVKSFDRWNTGMRHEGPSQKVQYLKGLAHLQKCMRDHSCRYGFIITEIELVCVRAGCDESTAPPTSSTLVSSTTGPVPYFGHLEVSDAIPVKASAAAATPTFSSTSTPFTAPLALYYLLMLAKSTPLPGQPGSFMDVGGPGALTRQKTWDGRDLDDADRGKDGKDKWIPEPQVGEKRDAKTARGWVWPSDPWHKREGGGSGRKARR